MRYDIQDGLILLNLKTVEYAYQVHSKVEEKLLRKQSQKNRGKNIVRGRGSPSSRGNTSKDRAKGLVVSHPREEGLKEAEEEADTKK